MNIIMVYITTMTNSVSIRESSSEWPVERSRQWSCSLQLPYPAADAVDPAAWCVSQSTVLAVCPASALWLLESETASAESTPVHFSLSFTHSLTHSLTHSFTQTLTAEFYLPASNRQCQPIYSRHPNQSVWWSKRVGWDSLNMLNEKMIMTGSNVV